MVVPKPAGLIGTCRSARTATLSAYWILYTDYMLRTVTRGGDGRDVVVLGLTEENWHLLSSKPILLDLRDVGLDVQVVVYRARDVDDLKVRAVELGLVDESILAQPSPTPEESTMWRRSDG